MMTTKKALIHIGGNKTGSTAIQSALFAGAARNTLGGAVYPELDPVSMCQHFLDVFYGDEKTTLPHLRTFAERYCIDTEALYRKYMAVIQSADNLILSSEILVEFSEDRVRRLKRDLDAAGYADYAIVVYVREPVSHYASFLQEILKQRRVCAQPSWHQYLGRMRQAIGVFAKVFGCEIHVKEFDRRTLAGGDVVLDFAGVATAFFCTEITLVPVSENESLTAEAAFILHEYRRGPPYSDADERIVPAEVLVLVEQLQQLSVQKHAGTKIVLREEVVANIAAQNVNDAAWFRQRYGIDFSHPDVPAAKRLDEPLRLEGIVVKPADGNIDSLRKLVHFPQATSISRGSDHESTLLDFVKSAQYCRKAIFGGGSVFHDLFLSLWLLHPTVKFDGLVFADRKPGPRRIRDWTFSFVHPDDVDWMVLDAVMICAPAFEDEICQYLLAKNPALHVHGMSAKPKTA